MHLLKPIAALLTAGLGALAMNGGGATTGLTASPEPSILSAAPYPLTLTASASEFVAHQATESGQARPPFDGVELRRQSGSTVTPCAAFGRPTISDNGIARNWAYRMPRQASGPCAVATGGRFFAVGSKGGVLTTSALTP